MSRLMLLMLWLLCTVSMPIICVAMFCQAAFGSKVRAKNMAIAQDACGNALFGGPPTQTMSARVGDALIMDQAWAKRVAPAIDFLFGKGHCLSNCDLPASCLTAEQKQLIDQADKDQDEVNQY